VRAIREVTYRGSHFERGLQRGLRLKDTLIVPDMRALPPAFVEGCRAAAARFHPPVIEEFEGLLRGGGFDREAMTAYYFARLESRLGGCTMFAVQPAFRKGGRGPIVGRNYDWAAEDLRWCRLERYFPADGLRRIGYTHHWAACPDVLNEGGLYLAIAALPPEPVLAPGVQWSILVDMVSECCTSVAEATAACARVVHLRPMSYLLADASGDVAVVEATPRRVTVRSPENGFVVATNRPGGGQALAAPGDRPAGERLAEPIGPRRGERSKDALRRATRRLRRAVELLTGELPGLSEEAVRRILADHEAPVCTGEHEHPDGAPWATIWSGICAPAEGLFKIAPGLPCRHPYHTFRFDA
jgi:hypothetical protein